MPLFDVLCNTGSIIIEVTVSTHLAAREAVKRPSETSGHDKEVWM